MKITKEQVQNMDTATITNAIHWLYDTYRRFEIGDAPKSKKQQLQSEAWREAWREALESLTNLLAYNTGARPIAEVVNVWTAPLCDHCGAPAPINHGDVFTTLCDQCGHLYHMGADAKDYIEIKAKGGKL